MNKAKKKPDYSLESAKTLDSQGVKPPIIKSVIVLEVEKSDVRCTKGDCQGDYVPG